MDDDMGIDTGSRKRKAVRDEEDRAAPPGHSHGELPYRDLSDHTKQKIRAAVKAKSLAGLDATEARWVDLFLAKNAATGKGLVKRGKKNSYSRGRYSKHKGAPRGRARRPAALSTIMRYNPSVGMTHTPIPREEIHKFSAATASWLTAVGSPFTPLRELPGEIMPRRPDPDFNGASVAVQTQSRQNVFTSNPPTLTANGQGNCLLFSGALPFSLAGLDVRGNQYYQGTPPTMPADFNVTNTSAYVIAQYITRLNAGQTNYATFAQQMADFTKIRATAKGLKAHDVGQVLTQQGEFFAHKCNWAKFFNSVASQVNAAGDAALIKAMACFGISGLMDYGNVSAGWTTTPAAVQGIIQNARIAATENTDIGSEKTPAMGITIRYNEPRTEVDFTDINPTVFKYDPGSSIALGPFPIATWRQMVESWPAVETFATAATGLALDATNTLYGYRSGQYVFYMLNFAANGASMLCNVQGLPVLWLEDKLGEHFGNQGNSLLCIEALQMIKDGAGIGRALNVYASNWAEIQVTGTSALYQSKAPTDGSYTQLVELACNFPVSVQGFSFFSNLWDGVKKAARWVNNNSASIIKGVQAGVNLAGKIA